jgi:hypothetical protein
VDEARPAAADPGRPWAPALAAAVVTLLTNPAAAVPWLSYYFRDFTVTFYPQRLFAAREWAAGRWPSWNPFVHEGTFALPALYPADLLLVLLPGPTWASWLLTLHLPLAAVAAFALARELSGSRWAAFLAGTVYATGGLALSSLNLYVFLQALAWAPLVALTLRRAAAGGGRAIAAAAAVTALALTTLAVEFVAQAMLLGLVLGLDHVRHRRALPRLGLALALGAGLAALPLAVVLGLLGETTRGAGFGRDVSLANELHPAVLLQALVPNLFGDLAAPVDAFWGGAFFSKGFPYFLSIYVGPLAISLALVGALGRGPHRRALLALGALGLWYALGSAGGLAAVVAALPGASAFRFPVKALLLPHLAVALLAAQGFDRLQAGSGWRAFRLAAAACFGVFVALPAAAAWWRPVSSYTVWVLREDALAGALLATSAVALAWAQGRGVLRPRLGALLAASLVAGDLVRAGQGLNPQASPRFFEPLPEMAALHLDRTGRVFTYGPDWSPAFLEFLNAPVPRKGLWSFFVNRQLLAPYANVLDEVELAQAKDVTAFVPHPPELEPAEYAPSAVSQILPRLRQASVTRVLSLDPLSDPALRPLAQVATGAPGLTIHAYAMEGWPRAFVACRARTFPDASSAYWAAAEPRFDPQRDVALEQPAPADCARGSARRTAALPAQESYEAEADGRGLLVIRASFARGWRATVDGLPAPVLRANAKHMAVPLPPGRHRVELRYRAPGWTAGLTITALAALGTAALALQRRAAGTGA